jgi:hypothetical protein
MPCLQQLPVIHFQVRKDQPVHRELQVRKDQPVHKEQRELQVRKGLPVHKEQRELQVRKGLPVRKVQWELQVRKGLHPVSAYRQAATHYILEMDPISLYPALVPPITTESGPTKLSMQKEMYTVLLQLAPKPGWPKIFEQASIAMAKTSH